jgi:hypothetical protein
MESMKNWEYTTEHMDRSNLENQLFYLGGDGWELVSIWDQRAIFKRQR